MYERYVKRLFDLSVSLTALILLSPVILITALLVRIKLGSPVMFTQVRPGYHGRPFAIYKFRTMTDERDEKGELLPDEVRLKPFGIWLRRLSLDELPQLLNVLRGDVSLVGPRPLLMSYLDIYTPEQARRHDVKPGMTGLAQVNGRNAISWEEKFRWDIKYVDELSLMMDIKILFKTVGKVLGSAGINQPGHATMSAFTGASAGKSSSLYALPELLRSLLITEADWNVVPRPVQAAVVLLIERMQTLERRLAAAENIPGPAVVEEITAAASRNTDFEDEPRTKPVDVPVLMDEEDITRPTYEPEGVAARHDPTISSNQERSVVAIEEMMDVTREVRYSPEEITQLLEEDTMAASRDPLKVPARIRK